MTVKQYIGYFLACLPAPRQVFLVVGLLVFLPDVALAGYFDEVAAGFSRSKATPEQLTMFAVYGFAIIILLVLLNLVREKKGAGRFAALLAIQLLCNAVLIYYLYL